MHTVVSIYVCLYTRAFKSKAIPPKKKKSPQQKDTSRAYLIRGSTVYVIEALMYVSNSCIKTQRHISERKWDILVRSTYHEAINSICYPITTIISKNTTQVKTKVYEDTRNKHVRGDKSSKKPDSKELTRPFQKK